MERPESAKAALRNLPILFSSEKRAKYANLLESHKEPIARTGKLPLEIIREAEKDFTGRSRIRKASFITGTIIGGILLSPQEAVLLGTTALGMKRASEGAWNQTKQLVNRLLGLGEKIKTRKLSPQQVYDSNLQIIEKRIRQLKRK
ncbi:MAG: hypothetical protein NTY90_02705 [Candidatus Micrarchaeota archaeon]|nr:hypothetical protein [Candidatus Micrarchaeota archaeon]